MKFVFVILHYCAVETTIKAINSILREIQGVEYEIVVVDNDSPDSSRTLLQEKYKCFSCFHLLQNLKNEGFARGNNAGYRYARDVLKADFIIVMNNDVILQQREFCTKILEVYKESKFYVLGPDIIGIDGKHQNPHRLKTFSLREINRIIVNRTIILAYLEMKRILRLSEKIQILEQWDTKRGLKEREAIDSSVMYANVVLHGSCLIFSPEYVKSEQEAFYKETFMWMEEEILAYLCQKKGYRMVYSPLLKVYHMEGISTEMAKDRSERYFFYSQQLRKSALIMKKLLSETDRGKR